jgi:hypothetical protein
VGGKTTSARKGRPHFGGGPHRRFARWCEAQTSTGSPGEHRAHVVGNGGVWQRTPGRSKAPRSSEPRFATTRGKEGAVTRWKLVRRGTLWRVEHRRGGERALGSTAKRLRNAVDLRVGRGMQQALSSLGGESRQGGEKPRRRNKSCAGSTWPKRAQARGRTRRDVERRRGTRVQDRRRSRSSATFVRCAPDCGRRAMVASDSV